MDCTTLIPHCRSDEESGYLWRTYCAASHDQIQAFDSIFSRSYVTKQINNTAMLFNANLRDASDLSAI
jgi:hypothetical protein